MKVFQGFDDIENIPHPVLTIGTFDGVHLGHQKIIKQINNLAEEIEGESVLYTFYPHPRMVLFPDSHGLKLIQTQEEKLEKLERMGLKNIIVYPFTKDFSRIPAIEFVRDFLVTKLKVKTLVIGYDHHFGRNREGNIDLLRELAPIYDFKVIEIDAKEIDEVDISSTKIRAALVEGDIALANSYLGEEFQINGKVVHGQKLGTKLGFPTANIDIESDIKLIPKNGVYATKVVRKNGGEHYGLVSIGERPTVDKSGKISIETYLLDFDGNLYDEYIKLKLLKRIRDEEKFDNLDQLINAMHKDEEIFRNWISTNNW
ncbi:MAG TPA: bifunctional riboflavin kinase/FAD synthetase [Brumimicrobium sp.]|nr:bifunctional riboflavin kinase/FAD synthetase [Brumimicrobium sp.]